MKVATFLRSAPLGEVKLMVHRARNPTCCFQVYIGLAHPKSTHKTVPCSALNFFFCALLKYAYTQSNVQSGSPQSTMAFGPSKAFQLLSASQVLQATSF